MRPSPDWKQASLSAMHPYPAFRKDCSCRRRYKTPGRFAGKDA